MPQIFSTLQLVAPQQTIMKAGRANRSHDTPARCRCRQDEGASQGIAKKHHGSASRELLGDIQHATYSHISKSAPGVTRLFDSFGIRRNYPVGGATQRARHQVSKPFSAGFALGPASATDCDYRAVRKL